MNEPPSKPAADESALFRRLADDLLSPEEFNQLEERLLADRGFRERCVRHLDLEASLYEELAAPSETAPLAARPAIVLSWRIVWAAAASLASIAATALIAIFAWPGMRGATKPGPGAEYVEAQLRGLEVAAIITHVEGVPAKGEQQPLAAGM